MIANRGSFGAFPEHTLGSYSSAYNENVDFIGIELQLTQDGHLVTSHDACLKNSTNIEDHSQKFEERRKSLNLGISNESCSNDFLIHDFKLEDLKTLFRT